MRGSRGGEANVTVWLGGILVVAGALALLGYGLYYSTQEFFGSTDVPLLVQVAVPAVVVGVVVLLGTVLVERVRRRKRERFEEVEY